MASDLLNEFSTGIRSQRNADGSWVSLGFTGQYINVTDSIPNPIERSIANKEFAVAEGASSDQPAIIGRVVQGANNEAWSVVAIASRGWDEKGRSASFYRYLWCDGDNGLSKILAWIDQYKGKHHGQFPIFDPFKKVVEENTYLSYNTTGENLPRDLLDSSVPIIIKPNQSYTLEQIHALAKEKAVAQPVSWAYNAEALEQPWRFVIIQPASDVAYERFRRAIANPPKVQKPVVADEQALRSAIKSLMGSSTVKQEAVEEIMTAIKNKEITKDYWHSLFDSQGARNALSQKIYSPQMIRLLTLRTLVIPETFSDYLNWLQINDSFQKHNINQAITGSLEFQSKLKTILTGYPQITKRIEYFVKQLRTESIPTKFWERIGDYIKDNISDSTLATYYYKLAALFEQDNMGSVNEKLFMKAFGSLNPSRQNIFNTNIIKKEPIKVPPQTVIFIAIFVFFLGGAGGYFGRGLITQSLSNTPNPNPSETPATPNPNSSPVDNQNGVDTAPKNQEPQNINIPKEIENTAIVNFGKTVEAIKAIETELTNKGKPKEETIRSIQEILGKNGQLKLDWKIMENQLQKESPIYEQAQKEWIWAIYEYQKRIGSQVFDGYISPGQGTAQKLKEDINKLFKEDRIDSPNNPPDGAF